MQKLIKKHGIISFQILAVLFLFISMILFPQQIFNASLRGLSAWWNVVFPALFPFFIISDLFMNLGIVHFIGVVLEPIMRPLFRVPGSGAFVVALGYTSGAPIGSIATAKLRKEMLLSREESEKIISFTNNASPLFMLSAVAVGMLNSPSTGIIIMISHYLANLVLGIFFLRRWGNPIPSDRKHVFSSVKKNILLRAYKELLSKRKPKPIAKHLSDAVKNSFNTLLLVGGFIVFFSTLIEVLDIFGVINLLAGIIKAIFFFKIDSDLARAIASGLVEMTIGAKEITETAASLQVKIASICFVLGWSGVSIQAQVMAFLNGTDIRIYPFIISRFLQGILGAMFSQILFHPTQNVFNFFGEPVSKINFIPLTLIFYNILIFIAITIALSIISIAFNCFIRNM